METAALEKDIRRFLTDQFIFGRSDELLSDQSLLGTLIDSTGTLVLVTYLQEHFEITVDDEDVVHDNLDSIEKMAA
jgi:acyl carrier protein